MSVLIGLFIWKGGSIGGKSVSPEAELLRLCRNDREQAERLIAMELKRRPGWSRDRAAKAAAYSIRRDNR